MHDFSKDIHEIYIVLYMIGLMVLIESLYDEFYSTFEDECSQGGEYCQIPKISVSENAPN